MLEPDDCVILDRPDAREIGFGNDISEVIIKRGFSYFGDGQIR